MWDTRKAGRQSRHRGGAEPPLRAQDAVEWARGLGLVADPLQARVLGTRSTRGVLNCSRQWGKSTITAAKG